MQSAYTAVRSPGRSTSCLSSWSFKMLHQKGARNSGPRGSRASFLLQLELYPAVPGPGFLIVTEGHRALFAVGHGLHPAPGDALQNEVVCHGLGPALAQDRKSTRLNSSHVASSYAVFSSRK